MRRIPFYPQLNKHFCGPAIAQMALAAHGIKVPQRTLAKEIGISGIYKTGTKTRELVAIIKKHGLEVRAGNNKNFATLKKELKAGSIVIACYTEPIWEWGHYAIIEDIRDDTVMLLDPDTRDGKTTMVVAEFKRRWKDPLFTKSVRWAAFVSAPKTKKK